LNVVALNLLNEYIRDYLNTVISDQAAQQTEEERLDDE
jgi:hypothetical protein